MQRGRGYRAPTIGRVEDVRAPCPPHTYPRANGRPRGVAPTDRCGFALGGVVPSHGPTRGSACAPRTTPLRGVLRRVPFDGVCRFRGRVGASCALRTQGRPALIRVRKQNGRGNPSSARRTPPLRFVGSCPVFQAWRRADVSARVRIPSPAMLPRRRHCCRNGARSGIFNV
ncbi:MAG: hypothetical protein BWY06_01291 [Candidatus Latescibacteria bacterium ADurb.Bin168]|nr:MAG: hypothetical protein BWY06_01291 [Candidatus Latescibacteria bacterium ADurb.Bin168]